VGDLKKRRNYLFVIACRAKNFCSVSHTISYVELTLKLKNI